MRKRKVAGQPDWIRDRASPGAKNGGPEAAAGPVIAETFPC